MKSTFVLIPIFLWSLVMMACSPSQTDESRLREFIGNHLKQVEPKITAMNVAEWNANATGEKKYYDENATLDLEVKRIRSNKADFAFLKDLKGRNAIHDSLLQRESILLNNNYLKNQIDTALLGAIVAKQSAIANMFNTFWGRIDGQEVSDNDISNILKNETNVAERKKAWEASKQVGQVVAPMVIELVRLRNQAAKQLGFEDYYVMSLATDEQNANDVIAIFDNLGQLTDEPFHLFKHDLDVQLSRRFGVSVDKLRPWHYQDPFFQDPPRLPAWIMMRSSKERTSKSWGEHSMPASACPSMTC